MAFWNEARQRWEVSVELEPGPDGKRRRKMFTGDKAGEVDARARSYKPPATFAADNGTVTDLLEAWFAYRCTGEKAIRPNTKANYRYIMDRMIIPLIGTVQVARLQDIHVTTMLSDLQTAGKKGRVRYLTWVVLNAALTYAVKRKKLLANIMTFVDKPVVVERKMQCLDEKEIPAFLKVIRNEDQFPLFLLALYSGMRLGELLGLQWSDVDMATGRINVRHTLLEVKKGNILLGVPCKCCGVVDGRGPVKTEAGLREIQLTPDIVAALTKQRERLFGLGLRASPWVFPNGGGTPMLQGGVRKLLKRFLKLAMVKKSIRFHDLRHSSATLMLTMGVAEKMLQQTLGQTDPKMLQRYIHAVQEHREIVAAKVAGVFAGI